jgi:hypothetical protein
MKAFAKEASLVIRVAHSVDSHHAHVLLYLLHRSLSLLRYPLSVLNYSADQEKQLLARQVTATCLLPDHPRPESRIPYNFATLCPMPMSSSAISLVHKIHVSFKLGMRCL